MPDQCEQCERSRRYAFAQSRLVDRMHRRAQAAESALATYIKALQQSGGVHESLYRPHIEGAMIERLEGEREA